MFISLGTLAMVVIVSRRPHRGKLRRCEFDNRPIRGSILLGKSDTDSWSRKRLHGAKRGSILVAALAIFGVLGGGVTAASAANVDLTVNVSSDTGTYAIDDAAVYTVRVDNRSDRDTAAGATVVLDVPNMVGSSSNWDTAVSAVSTGGGADAPTGFVRSTNGQTVTATLPSLPAGGWVSYALTAPGHPASGVTGSITVSATVTPAAGDTDVELGTNTSTVGVVILDVLADYATTLGNYPGSSIADGGTFTTEVTFTNSGVGNTLAGSLGLSGDLADGSQIVGIELLSGVGPEPTITPSTSISIPMDAMDSGASNVYRVTIDAGATCTTAPDTRVLTLNSTVSHNNGVAEPAGLNSDNDATANVSALTPACLYSDVSVTLLEQTEPAAPASIPAGGPFEFQAVYTNSGPDTATNEVVFTLGWPTGEGAPSFDVDPTCVATGGATCPTSWSLEQNVVEGVPGAENVRGSSSATATGSDAIIPPGETIIVTYTGIGGAEDTLICGSGDSLVDTRIAASSQFYDSDTTNNQETINVQGYVGVDCGINRDLQLEVPRYLNDPSSVATPTGTLVVSPGDTVYYDITASNESDPDQAGLGEAGTAPYVDINGYTRLVRFGFVAPTNFVANNQQFDLSDPGNVFWQSDTGDIPVTAFTGDLEPMASDNPLNIMCMSSAPVVCPDYAERRSNQFPTSYPYAFNMNLLWSEPDQTVLPAGETLRLLAGFKVPDLLPQYEEAGCVPPGVLINGSPTATSVSMGMRLDSFAEETDNLSGEINGTNDRYSLQWIQVNYTRCAEDLQIDQSIVDGSGVEIVSPTLGSDRAVRYAVTITNPAGSSELALPRFTQAFSPEVESVTATCDPALSTGGAICPVGTFTGGVRHLADGSTEALSLGDAQLDITWGDSGAATLPADSSVTFYIEVAYPVATATAATATATAFDSEPGSPFPLVSDSDAIVPATSDAVLTVRKSVTPIDPEPGETVSFVVDLLNAGTADTSAVFTDPMSAGLLAANPSGFGNVTCTPVTAGMNLLDGTLGSTPCPTITSDATGLHADIPVFEANSGLRISYTAIAPDSSVSISNVANLLADGTQATTADRAAWVNFLTQEPAALTPASPDEENPSLARTGASSNGELGLASMLLGFGLLLLVSAMVRRRRAMRGQFEEAINA